MSLKGNLLAESLCTGEILDAVPLVVRKIWRLDVGDTSVGQPLTWTFIEFEAPEASAGALSSGLSEVLEEGPWYCDFRSDHETFVVFAGRVFRYARGDQRGRSEAEEHARSVGIPEAQIDWRE